MSRQQADYATYEEVRHHIEMQRKYGEIPSCDDDYPKCPEFLATAIIAIAAAVAFFWG